MTNPPILTLGPCFVLVPGMAVSVLPTLRLDR